MGKSTANRNENQTATPTAKVLLHPTATTKLEHVGNVPCAGCDVEIPIYSLNGVLMELDDTTELHRPGCRELEYYND